MYGLGSLGTNQEHKLCFYMIGYLLSTYSVPNTPNIPNIYITATVTDDSRAHLPNFYLIIPNLPDQVQNRGIRHVLGVFFHRQKVVSKFQYCKHLIVTKKTHNVPNMNIIKKHIRQLSTNQENSKLILSIRFAFLIVLIRFLKCT